MEPDRAQAVQLYLDELARPPLTSHEVIINTIGATTTRAGLAVQARLDGSSYLKGVKITDRQMRELEKTRLTRDPWHGEWNYALHPHTTPNDHDVPNQDLDLS